MAWYSTSISNFFRLKFLLIFCIALLGLGIFYFANMQKQKTRPDFGPPKTIKVLGKEKVKYPEDYLIVMVGDSMTETLGNSDELKKFLRDYYRGKTFEVLNYGFGATSILTVMDRINSETKRGRVYRPIKDIDYDVILLE